MEPSQPPVFPCAVAQVAQSWKARRTAARASSLHCPLDCRKRVLRSVEMVVHTAGQAAPARDTTAAEVDVAATARVIVEEIFMPIVVRV